MYYTSNSLTLVVQGGNVLEWFVGLMRHGIHMELAALNVAILMTLPGEFVKGSKLLFMLHYEKSLQKFQLWSCEQYPVSNTETT